jgi:hypothetical protein
MEEKKICSGCGQERDPEHDFSWKYKERGIRNARCKYCQSLKSKQHYEHNKQPYLERARTREAWVTEDNQRKLAEYFSSHPCVDCSQNDVRVLEFDHVRGKKSNDISKMMTIGCSWSTIEAEIAKCEVRCANCHRIRESKKGNSWRQLFNLQYQEDLLS